MLIRHGAQSIGKDQMVEKVAPEDVISIQSIGEAYYDIVLGPIGQQEISIASEIYFIP